MKLKFSNSLFFLDGMPCLEVDNTAFNKICLSKIKPFAKK